MEICLPVLNLLCSASISPYLLCCPPSLRCSLLPALFSLSARFWFRLHIFFQQETNSHDSLHSPAPHPHAHGESPVLGAELPWGSPSLAVPREAYGQPSWLETASALLLLGWREAV